MEVIGLKRIGLSKIRLPGDFKERLKRDSVFHLANSIQQRGLIHEPLVRQSDYKLIAGHDRVAAHFVRGWQTITVKLVECSDAELEVIQREENVLRRNDPDEQRRLVSELVEAYERELNEKIAEDPTVALGRQSKMRQPRAMAVERVAKLKGVSKAAVYLQIQKKKKREEAKKNIPIVTWGMNVSDKFLNEVGTVYQQIHSAMSTVRNATSKLTQLESKDVPFPKKLIAELKTTTQEAGRKLEDGKPAALCPGCKGVDVVQSTCEMCAGFGWVTEGAMQLIAEAYPGLLNIEKPMLLVRGKLVPLTDYIPEEPIAPVEEESPWY